MHKDRRGRAGLWIAAMVLTILCSMVSLADTKPTKPGASPAKKGSWEVNGSWVQDDNGYHFVDDKGRTYEDEWLQFYGNWYYIGLDHYMHLGWLQDGDNWYYMEPDGIMHKGWLEYDGALYYFSEMSGEMKRTGYYSRGHVDYKIDSDGRASALTRSTGVNHVNDWFHDGTGWMYINPDWTVVTGRWFESNGKFYHFDTNGYMQTGWLPLNSGTYYLGSDGVMLANTTQMIDGDSWTFAADGKLIQ